MSLLEEFGMRYLTCQLPPWFYRLWATVSTVPLFKTNEQVSSSWRPVGVKGSLVRSLHKLVAKRNRRTLQEYLEPQQLCMSPAGGHKLVMEEHIDWVCIKLDVSNAHNSISRAAILEVMEQRSGMCACPTNLQDEGKGVECVLAPPISSMSRSSFQELLVRLPVGRGGLGLRSCLNTSPAAFVGSVEMSVDGVCRLLEPVLGDLHLRQDLWRIPTPYSCCCPGSGELPSCQDGAWSIGKRHSFTTMGW